MISHRHLPWLALLLFVISGFSGLIYQSIWSHYLGLLLGHAAYAQALVLAIFMGGMAIGAWLASRWSLSWVHLFKAYALIELCIGVLGLAFHPVFTSYTGWLQASLLPSINNAALASVIQWAGAALLITPQSILLGMTFPIMSAAFLRVVPDQQGEVLGGLYFSNSIGAAFGALASTFLLLPAVGLPGTVFSGGVLNIIVAAIAWFIASPSAPAAPIPNATTEQTGSPLSQVHRVLFFAAFITGATSFVYEIAWVRMLNQVLGATVHSFELMLASFILGLALGGLWVRWRAPRIVDALRFAGVAQAAMGIAALISLPAFASSFGLMEWLMGALTRSESGYVLFSLGGAGLAMMIMFPAAFFAGMTLPLFTLALLKRGYGESVIGRVYAFNTIGAIIGVAAAIHLMIPLLGLANSVFVAALIDVALGLWLLLSYAQVPARRHAMVSVATTAVVAALALMVTASEHQRVSGVYRNGFGSIGVGADVKFLRDGKTATVGVYDFGPYRSITTNGKPDAALRVRHDEVISPDEVTMALAGLLPLIIRPEARDFAIIGWGSGLTTHTLLGSTQAERVVSIEIERAMHEGARLFGDRVARAYSDPRNELVVEDARTYFATGQRQFDVIVSEPSNPWVSGVANLFTREFYSLAKAHLTERGVLVQWLQTYELSDELLATMLAAMLEVFPHVDAYGSNTNDLLLVGSEASIDPINWSILGAPDLRDELALLGLGTQQEFELRRIWPTEALSAFVHSFTAATHSDYFPSVSLQAPRARFMSRSAYALKSLADSGLPIFSLLSDSESLPEANSLSFASPSVLGPTIRAADNIARALKDGGISSWSGDRNDINLVRVTLIRHLSQRLVSDSELPVWLDTVGELAKSTMGVLEPVRLRPVWVSPAWMADSANQPEAVRLVMSALAAIAERDPKAMSERSLAALRFLNEEKIFGSPALENYLGLAVILGELGSGSPERALAANEGLATALDAYPPGQATRKILVAWAQMRLTKESQVRDEGR